LRSVVRETGEVEVRKRSTWEKIASEHLADRLDIEAKTSDTKLGTEEESEQEGKT